jgi:hypothetical protein
MSSRAFACAGDDEREWGAGSRHMAYCSRGAFRPSLKSFRPRKSEGAGNAGCALHPRSRVPKLRIQAHTSIQVQRKHSGIPRAMALRLTSCSSRRRIPFCHRRLRIKALSSRLDRHHLRSLGISNGCQNHTTSPYAASSAIPRQAICCLPKFDESVEASLVLHTGLLLTRFISPCNAGARHAATSTASHPDVQ